jgi:hypothetical protein
VGGIAAWQSAIGQLMSLRAIQSKGHAVIDAHYAEMAAVVRKAVLAAGPGVLTPALALALQAKIQAAIAAQEGSLAQDLGKLFDEAEADGEKS